VCKVKPISRDWVTIMVMTKWTKRAIQLCTFAAAIAAIDRPSVLGSAKAFCYACISQDVCKQVSGGVQGCRLEGGSCTILGNSCNS